MYRADRSVGCSLVFVCPALRLSYPAGSSLTRWSLSTTEWILAALRWLPSAAWLLVRQLKRGRHRRSPTANSTMVGTTAPSNNAKTQKSYQKDAIIEPVERRLLHRSAQRSMLYARRLGTPSRRECAANNNCQWCRLPSVQQYCLCFAVRAVRSQWLAPMTEVRLRFMTQVVDRRNRSDAVWCQTSPPPPAEVLAIGIAKISHPHLVEPHYKESPRRRAGASRILDLYR